MTHLLDDLPDPKNLPYAQAHTGLERCPTCQIKTYGIEEPPSKPENALPHGIIHSIMASAVTTYNIKTPNVSDMLQLGFYFCLRSCEYTKCTGHRQTGQLQPLLEFVFFVGDRLLPADASIEHLYHDNHIFFTLDNQKNAIQGESVSHF